MTNDTGVMIVRIVFVSISVLDSMFHVSYQEGRPIARFLVLILFFIYTSLYDVSSYFAYYYRYYDLLVRLYCKS